MTSFSRRSILGGMVQGAKVAVALPILDLFLGGNGDAWAATQGGGKLPTRMGTFFWGLGLTPGQWAPKTEGAGWELTPDLESLGDLRKKVNVFSGFRVMLDAHPNLQHWTGQGAVLTGTPPPDNKTFTGASFDTMVADAIGAGTRYRSIEVAPFGYATHSYSTRGTGFNTPDVTPLALYTRLFGEGFRDPNSGNWAPDPKVMLRQSVLSAVGEQRAALDKKLGAADRERLDQYFTSVRQMEQRLDVELEKPAPALGCARPQAPKDVKQSGDVPSVREHNRMMAELLAMGLACNQTRVVNAVFTSATSELYLPGDHSIYHTHTHEEAIDPKTGCQPISSKLAKDSFAGYAEFLKALDNIKEGDGTLLDRCAVLGFSDTGNAKIHSTDDIPMFIAGGANGKLKTGMHVHTDGEPVSRVALTIQQAVGLPVGSWGKDSLATTKPVTEVFA